MKKKNKWVDINAVYNEIREGYIVQAKCSACNRYSSCFDRYSTNMSYDYCPRCGVRMDGAE